MAGTEHIFPNKEKIDRNQRKESNKKKEEEKNTLCGLECTAQSDKINCLQR